MNIYGFNFEDTITGLISAMALGITSGYLLYLFRLLLFTWLERKG